MREIVADLRDKSAAIELGGDETSRRRHGARGKLLPRERVEPAARPGLAVSRTALLAAYDMYDGAVPAAGIVTGIGRISGRNASSSPTTRRSRAAPTSR